MKNTKKFFLVLLIGLMIFSLTACGGNEDTSPEGEEENVSGKGTEPMTLKLSHHVSEDDSNHVFAKSFAKAVEELSDGQMKVEIYPNGQLFGQAEALSALSQGTLDIALSDTALFANYDPAGALFDMPYLIDSREQAIKIVKSDEVLSTIKDIMIEKADIRVLSVMPLHFRNSLAKDESIDSIEGFKDFIMRTPEAPHTIAAFKAFGANPTVIPSGEAYTSVQTGVADGLEGHPEYVYLQKFYEVAKNYVQTKHVFTFTAYSMSQSKYESMSDAQKEVIDQAVETGLNDFLDYTETLFEDALTNLEKEGVAITEVDLEPFKAATEDYLNSFIEENDLQDVLEKIQALK